ncbi:MAG: hypothetical protein J07HQW1_02861 [Haloquadratum walsbyi J07HQW1]|uniref:Uncharacterized protein n=1 Tax=Haloquadratum walsbyi J07HQW1 TaxID=1238424 RepID=U1N8G0_9EURY|nr:MAG: hypothetical protein J07HQW1_02861 [Haloquadratum walsbyi J07HQW1]
MQSSDIPPNESVRNTTSLPVPLPVPLTVFVSSYLHSTVKTG